MKSLITYHNDITGVAMWVSDKYEFTTKDPRKFLIMRETNQLLRDPEHSEQIAAGIHMMLKYDGAKHDY